MSMNIFKIFSKRGQRPPLASKKVASLCFLSATPPPRGKPLKPRESKKNHCQSAVRI